MFSDKDLMIAISVSVCCPLSPEQIDNCVHYYNLLIRYKTLKVIKGQRSRIDTIKHHT